MRYCLELAYNGSRFHGFQEQPNTPLTIQHRLESKLQLLVPQASKIIGCGRTDAGVHARQYFAHFDSPQGLREDFVHRYNQILGPDIYIKRCFEVRADFHARFDALSRGYSYQLLGYKDPFSQETSFQFGQMDKLDWVKVQEAAALLPRYPAFAPFCKTHTDSKTRFCKIEYSVWRALGPEHYVYEVQADRFLRGMVRLIVGMCLYVGLGKLSLDQVENALANQTPLPRPWSAPAQGLFLDRISYPDF